MYTEFASAEEERAEAFQNRMVEIQQTHKESLVALLHEFVLGKDAEQELAGYGVYSKCTVETPEEYVTEQLLELLDKMERREPITYGKHVNLKEFANQNHKDWNSAGWELVKRYYDIE